MSKRHFINILTLADGSFTYFFPKTSGKLSSLHYIKDTANAGANALANGVDFTFTVESTGEAVLTLTDQNTSGSWRPRVPTVSPANAAQLYAAGGSAVNDKIEIASDRIKLVIAQGGNAKVGQVIAIMD